MNEVDDEYRKRMFQFELDCDDGKGNAYACHSVGEFVALIDRDYTKAGDVWRKNCDGKNKYPPSCFKLGMLLFKGQGVKEQSDVAAASTPGAGGRSWRGVPDRRRLLGVDIKGARAPFEGS